jgi:dTDP-4-dehydrorhamnose 3,5-epimerase
MTGHLAEHRAMTIRKPKSHEGPLADAWDTARDRTEPVFVPARHYTDDRGWSLMNQMQGVLRPEGQINFSTQYPGVIKAWHRHQKQTDFWMCLTGHIKVGVHREADGQSWALVIGEQRPGTLIIPPPLWHGAATIGAEPAGLLYYVTESYNPAEPDEQRRSFDSVQGFAWETEHR